MWEIAFCIRKDYQTRTGGDSIQLLKTKKYLESIGKIRVEVVTDPQGLTGKRYDICQIFNMQVEGPTRNFIDICKREGIAIALSPLFWNSSYALANTLLAGYLGCRRISRARLDLAGRILKLISPLAGTPRFFTRGYREEYVSRVLRDVDLVLPNSAEELQILSGYPGVEAEELKRKSFIVFNGVDIGLDNDPQGAAVAVSVARKYGLPEKYVLQVGRIEPVKNQMTLLRALNGIDIPIVFLGDQQASRRYFHGVRKLANKRGNVFFVESVPHEEMKQLYRRAALHALPSLQETTGLASLEALASGCRAVVSDRGYCPYDTYFNGVCTPVDPLDSVSVREGVLKEMKVERDMDEIKWQVNEKFSWRVSAKQTFDAYKRVLQ